MTRDVVLATAGRVGFFPVPGPFGDALECQTAESTRRAQHYRVEYSFSNRRCTLRLELVARRRGRLPWYSLSEACGG